LNKVLLAVLFTVSFLILAGSPNVFAQPPCTPLIPPQNLDVLLANPANCIIIDDKIFTNFREFQSDAQDEGDGIFVIVSPADPSKITVNTKIFGDEIGIFFQSRLPNTWNILGPSVSQDTSFKYDVISLGPPINDNTLRIRLFQFNSEGTLTETSVQEKVFDIDGIQIALKEVFNNSDGVKIIQVHKDFTPQQMITVNTIVELSTGTNFNNFIVLKSINQTFSQQSKPIGGEIIPIETTSLILAGAQSFSWMIPVVLSVLGIGLIFLRRR